MLNSLFKIDKNEVKSAFMQVLFCLFKVYITFEDAALRDLVLN